MGWVRIRHHLAKVLEVFQVVVSEDGKGNEGSMCVALFDCDMRPLCGLAGTEYDLDHSHLVD